MMYKKSAQGNSPGISFKGVPCLVVPDQSLKLQDILARFVRREALPVGQVGRYGSEGSIDPESDSPLNIDQEKAKYWDLTEKDEFAREVMRVRAEHETKVRKLEAEAKAKKEADEKAAFDKKVRIAARKYAKENPGGTPGSI